MKELSLVELSSFDGETEDVNVIVETHEGIGTHLISMESTSSSSSLRFFRREWSFPSGFVPSTRREDGDPFDILRVIGLG